MNSDINKVLSFVLGLIVVVVFIAIVMGKFKLGNGLSFLSKNKSKVTPPLSATVTPLVKTNNKVTINYPTTTPVTTKYMANGSNTQIAGSKVAAIPTTGAETMILPGAFSLLGAGIFLKKKFS